MSNPGIFYSFRTSILHEPSGYDGSKFTFRSIEVCTPSANYHRAGYLTLDLFNSARQDPGLLDEKMITFVVFLLPDQYCIQGFSTSHHEVTVCSCMLIEDPTLLFDTKRNVCCWAHGKPESEMHEDG